MPKSQDRSVPLAGSNRARVRQAGRVRQASALLRLIRDERQASLDLTAILSILFQVYLATHFAYWGWNSLLKLYPVSTVAPLSLLIPVFGVAGSMLILGHKVGATEGVSIALILSALVVGLLKWPRGLRLLPRQ